MSDGDDSHRRWGRLVVWGPFSTITEADLHDVERVVGATLPDSYRSFMQVANGGSLPYAVRLPPDDPGGDVFEFNNLFSVVGDRGETLIGEWKAAGAHKVGRLPAMALPVAMDGGGSTLYLSLAEPSYGQVWALVHELAQWDEGDAFGAGLVATSWDDYVDMLFIDEDMAQDVWDEGRTDGDPRWLRARTEWLDAGLPGWRSSPWARSDRAAEGDVRSNPPVRSKPSALTLLTRLLSRRRRR